MSRGVFSSPPPTQTHRFSAHARWLVLSALFVVNRAQEPLFSSNQNDKFLSGAGAAGFGGLENEWTAGTLDPLPLFSLLVEVLFRLDAIEAAYVLYGALLGVYLYSLLRIAETVFPSLRDLDQGVAVVALLFLVHNVYLWGVSEGLAGQFVAGTYFQPSVFGAFVLLAISRLLRDDAVQGGLWLGVAVAFHPTYGLAAVLVLTGYAIATVRSRRDLVPVLLSGGLFALVAGPFVVRAVLLFGPTSEETWNRAVTLVSDVRIAHHTRVERWFAAEHVFRILGMIWLLFAVRGTRLFSIAGALFLPIAIGVPALHLHPDPALRFTTPWRTSTILMPITLAIGSAWIVSRTIPRLRTRWEGESIRRRASGAIAALAVIGAIRQVGLFWKYERAGSMPLVRFARQHLKDTDHALVPPGTEDLYRFRLETGVPVLVNWKSHPHKDVEVIEWEERLTASDRFYRGLEDGDACKRLAEIRARWPVTVVVLPADHRLASCSPPAREIYSDHRYRLVRLSAP